MPAAAAPIRPLAWELPYALGAALKKKKSDFSSSGFCRGTSSIPSPEQWVKGTAVVTAAA